MSEFVTVTPCPPKHFYVYEITHRLPDGAEQRASQADCDALSAQWNAQGRAIITSGESSIQWVEGTDEEIAEFKAMRGERE